MMEKGKLNFLCKNIIKLQVIGLIEEGALLRAVPSSTSQSFMVETLNPAVHV
jgi:hypothetical protein